MTAAEEDVRQQREVQRRQKAKACWTTSEKEEKRRNEVSLDEKIDKIEKVDKAFVRFVQKEKRKKKKKNFSLCCCYLPSVCYSCLFFHSHSVSLSLPIHQFFFFFPSLPSLLLFCLRIFSS